MLCLTVLNRVSLVLWKSLEQRNDMLGFMFWKLYSLHLERDKNGCGEIIRKLVTIAQTRNGGNSPSMIIQIEVDRWKILYIRKEKVYRVGWGIGKSKCYNNISYTWPGSEYYVKLFSVNFIVLSNSNILKASKYWRWNIWKMF